MSHARDRFEGTAHDCYEYVRRTYHVPAHRGVVVTYRGKQGRIIGKRGGQQYVYVLLDDADQVIPIHPTDSDLTYHPEAP